MHKYPVLVGRGDIGNGRLDAGELLTGRGVEPEATRRVKRTTAVEVEVTAVRGLAGRRADRMTEHLGEEVLTCPGVLLGSGDVDVTEPGTSRGRLKPLGIRNTVSERMRVRPGTARVRFDDPEPIDKLAHVPEDLYRAVHRLLDSPEAVRQRRDRQHRLRTRSRDRHRHLRSRRGPQNRHFGRPHDAGTTLPVVRPTRL
jgi:hypothetical protein